MEKINNLYEISLCDIAGLSIHFSSDCNMACKYCYIEKDKFCMADYNRKIREALKDGTFAKNIKNRLGCIKEQIFDISLWGAEPTINSKLFKDFIYELLDFFPNIDSFMFSTNALLGGELIYEDFIVPLIEYCNSHKQKITFTLQLSLDGPPEFNDDSRHEGATASTLNTLYLLCQKIPKESPYFKLKMITKSTLDVSYMEIMNKEGISKFQWYFDFLNEIRETSLKLTENNPSVECDIGLSPTLVDPGWHTIENGRTLAKWIHNLQYVDRSKYTSYYGLLFSQGFEILTSFFADKNPLASGVNIYSCSASKNNVTIDWEGNLYTCNRLCRNAALSDKEKNKVAMQSNSTMNNVTTEQWLKRTWGSFSIHDNILARWHFLQGQIILLAKYGHILPKYFKDEDQQKLLFYFVQGFLCHIGAEEDYTQNPYLAPFSYLKYFGNGAIDELIEYYQLEVMRGNVRPWSIAM